MSTWKDQLLVINEDKHLGLRQFSVELYLLGSGERCCEAIKALSQYIFSGIREIQPSG